MGRYFRTFVGSFAAVSLVVLTACGGGGGGAGGAGDPQGPVPGLQVLGALDGSAAQIALNAAGHGYAMWGERTADGAFRLVSQRHLDGQWLPRAQVLAVPPDVDIGAASLAVLADGEAVAVWVRTSGEQRTLEGARTQGHVWVPFATAIRELDAAGVFPTIRLEADGLGKAILLGAGQFPAEAGKRIFATTLTKEGFGPVETISTDQATGIDFPDLAVAANGDAIASWNQSAAGTSSSVHVRAYAAGQWAGAASIDLLPNSTTRSFAPSVSIGPTGVAAVAWPQRQAGVNKLMFSTADQPLTGNWTVAAELNNPSPSVSNVQMVQDAQGGIVTVWTAPANGAGSRTDLWGQRAGPGALASPGQIIEVRDEGSILDPTLAGGVAGGVVAVWVQDVDSADFSEDEEVFFNRFDPVTGQWGRAEMLVRPSVGRGDVDSLDAARDATGRTLILRTQVAEDGTRSLVLNELP